MSTIKKISPLGFVGVTFHQLGATAPDAESKRAFIDEGANAVTLKIERLLPDNPLRLDESFLNYTPEQITKHGFQLRDLVRASRPQRPLGRPKKSVNNESSLAGSRAIDKECSDRYYQMSLDGKHWHAIARVIYPTLHAAGRRTRKIEKRISRFIERGRLNAKKDGRNK